MIVFCLLYQFLLHLLFLGLSIKFFFNFKNKYSTSWRQRLGLDFPFPKEEGRFVIWIHAISVGESKAVAPLVKRLRKEHPEAVIYLSSVTQTGHEEAKRSILEADYHVYCPLDFIYIVRPLLKRLKVKIFILTESDFWFQFLFEAKRYGAKTIVVNGKISNRSCQRFRFFGFFRRRLFSLIDIFCVQNSGYQEAFLSLGVPESKIHVTGNMKFDATYPESDPTTLQCLMDIYGIEKGDQVLVLGSSHSGEEECFTEALFSLRKQFPRLKAFVVPRHPERFDLVANALASRGIEFSRSTSKGKSPLILVDEMGLLRSLYPLADVAIVGGSFFSGVGGHNILEPSYYSVPVVFGPYMQNQKEMEQLMLEHKAGIQTTAEKLRGVLEELLRDTPLRKSLGINGKRLFCAQEGAVERTEKALKSILSRESS